MPSQEIMSKKLRDSAKKAGEQAAREAIMEMQFGDETDSLNLEELDGSSASNKKERDPGFDLFEDVGRVRAEAGEIVQYIIRKNNERVGTKRHPYSWDKLARDFGPGTYQVIARSESKKCYLSSETQVISEDAEVFARNEPETDDGATHAVVTPGVAWQQPQMSFIEMFNLMQTQSDRARQEAMQTATQQAQSQVAMITAMTEMMKNAQLQSQTMFMEMTKMNAQMAEKMAQAQEKIVEKINQRMDKLADVATKKPEGPSWIDVMKMNNESQNKGFELFEKIMKLAELKAEEKVELLENARELNGGEEKKKSLTDSLIESLLPAIAGAVANPQLQAQHQQQQLLLQRQQQQLAAQRRGLRAQQQLPLTQQPVQTNGVVQRRPRVAEATPKKDGETKTQTTQKSSGSIIQDSGDSVSKTILRPNAVSKAEIIKPPQVLTQVDSLGSEVSVKDTQVERLVADKVVASLADKVEVIDTPAQNVNEVKTEVKAHCKEILPVFLGGLMLEAVESKLAAERTLQFLNEHGISRDLFLTNVEAKDLIDVAVEYDLPKEAHQWLNELYANIQSKSRTDVRRKSTEGGEYEATDRG